MTELKLPEHLLDVLLAVDLEVNELAVEWVSKYTKLNVKAFYQEPNPTCMNLCLFLESGESAYLLYVEHASPAVKVLFEKPVMVVGYNPYDELHDDAGSAMPYNPDSVMFFDEYREGFAALMNGTWLPKQ